MLIRTLRFYPRRMFTAVLLSLIVLVIVPPVAVGQDEAEPAPVSWPSQYYAPYTNAGNYPLFFFWKLAETDGLRFFTLSFVLDNGNCQAAWSGSAPINKLYLMDDLTKLRAMGGDVIVSFGGAAGTELAEACPDVDSLAAQYQSVVDTLGVTHLDFDIEGASLGDVEANDRRSEALARLQSTAAEAGKAISISFTLPVLTSGLTDAGVALLQSAIDHDVDVDVVNIMTMDFEKSAAGDKMGENTIQAANNLFDQLKLLYPTRTDDALWNMIGLTPMIGVNDLSEQIFTLDDAQAVTAFAQEQNIQRIAIWSLERDKACEFETRTATSNCSSVTQDPLGFSTTFNQLTVQAVP